jgi:RHS repeat-associated protein
MALGAALALASPAAAAKGPDLTVSKLQASGSAAPGQQLTATVTVKNAGGKKAKASQTAFVLSKDAKRSNDDRRLTTGNVKALAPRKTAKSTVHLTIPAGTPAGVYHVVACADARKKVKEANEKNNCRASGNVTVLGPPFVPPPSGNPGPIPGGSGGPGPGPTPTPAPSPTPTPTATPTPTPTPPPHEDPFPKPPLTPPADPGDVAPDPPQGGATTVSQGTEFLYTGNDPIQKEVAPDTIAPKQVAVLRGRVLGPDGSDAGTDPDPIAGARVTVLDHPEFGYTATRDDGGYDLAVNGGQDLVLQFEQKDFATVQRTESVPWQDFVRLDDVVMTPYSPVVTPVNQNAQSLTAVTSDTSSDGDGDRKATLMFDPGTNATMTLPNGQTQPLSNTMQVRATEYTVGTGGEQRMPGELPDTSAYTYAVEFSIDQASQNGATDVEFNKPVATYVDNFLNFKAGTIVPAAYYDKDKAAWVPSNNGIVIKVVSELNGKAQVDVDGDGFADSGTELSDLGIDDAELTKLGQQYNAGDSLWRVQVKHFTPWDYNWPYGCPDDCPPPKEDPPPPPYCPECQAAGSIVGVFNQTLGERQKITGTPFALHYDSGRMPGYKDAYSVEIPLTGNSVSGNLLGVSLQVSVAGREFNYGFPAAPNLKHTFVWDGKDAYGRLLEGQQTAKVRIGYVYRAVYLSPEAFQRSFAQFGNRPVDRNDGGPGYARRSITVWQEWERPLGTLGAGSDALGGWTFDVHHSYDPQGKTLYLGDGTRVNTEAIRSEIRTVAGFDPYSYIHGGTPATQTDLGLVRGTDVGPDGSIYIAETSLNRVLKVTPNGGMSVVAGGGAPQDDIGDGGPAVAARLVGPTDVAVAKDGSLYISDTGNARIRRVAPDGTISTFAGGGDPDTLGDGGAATKAGLHGPRGIALTDDGTLYVAEAGADRVRRITPDGNIATAVGGGTPSSGIGDGGQATDASLDRPVYVAIDGAGTLYVSDSGHHRLRSVTPSGVIDTVAGDGNPGSSGDGGPAKDAEIGSPSGVDVGRDGTVYVADRIHHRIRRISPEGTITTFAGSGHSGGDGDGGPPQQADLSFPEDVSVAPDDSVLIDDSGNNRIRRAALGLPGFADADFSLPSQDGTEVYMFDGNGRHLRTVDALTGSLRYQFAYDAAGRLASITDGDGNVTTITRDGNGNATGIVAPGAGAAAARTTALSIGNDGYLASINDPEGDHTGLGYGDGGLLTTFTDPIGNSAHFAYDPGTGLLTSDRDASGAETTYSRALTAGGSEVTKTSPEGRVTKYETAKLADGSMQTTVTEPSGAKTVTVYGKNGVTRVTGPDGTVVSSESGPDPRWGMRAPIPVKVTTTTPGGITKTVTRSRSVTLTQEGDLFSIDHLQDSSDHGGRTDTMSYDGATRVATTTTAQGREFTTTIDAKGRPIERAMGGGTDPIAIEWNAKGRVGKISQGAHSVTMTYDADHPYRVLTRKDAAGRTTTYTYDNAERITSIKLPSGHTYTYAYDDAGNRTSVAMPNGQVHNHTFDALGRATGYSPSAGNVFGRTFDHDGFATSFTLPGGGTRTLTREASGRLSGETSPDGTSSTFTYPTGDGTDRFTQADRNLPNGRQDSTRVAYDGALVTSKESRDGSGPYGAYAYGYDDQLRLQKIDLTSGSDTLSQSIQRDADNLVTSQGAFTFDRSGPAGLTSGISGDGLALAIGYATTGAQKSRTTTVAGQAVFDTQITRDNSGRITQKTEKVGSGAAVTYAYDYFPDGELKSVQRDGSTVEQYAYDVNGNRTSRQIGAAAAQAATYAADDHLLTLGGTSYGFDAAGMMTSRGADTFTYSDAGELLQATAGGHTVRYTYDSAGRRVARSVDGGGRYEYLYGDPRRPQLVTATRDPAGELTTYQYDEDDLLFAMQRGGKRYFVATDQVGTPRVVADDTGAIVKRLDYDAFGVRTGDTDPNFDLAIGFAGGIDDRLTGLVRFTLRDYDPAAGRFTARDPIFQGGGPNTYAYADNNPVGLRDQLGLDGEGGGGGGIGGFFSGLAQKVSDFFTSEPAGKALDAVSSIDSDSPIVEGAGTLKDGIDKVQLVQEGLDTALELKEASQAPSDPEQAAGYLKCGLKWLKKILPIDLVGTEAASKTLDEGMVHAQNQHWDGTINAGEASQLRQIDW